MISKGRLIQIIDEALRTEERVIAIYCTHCAISVDMTEEDSKELEPFRRTVLRLRDESRGHRDTLEGLRRDLLKDDRDAY